MTDKPRTPPWLAHLAAAQEGAQEVARQVVGLQLHAANELANRAGCRLRVVRRNGIGLAVTADLDPRRINVEIDGDTVAGASLG